MTFTVNYLAEERDYWKEKHDKMSAQRDKAIAFLKDIATEQIRGATQPQLRTMLIDAIIDLERCQ